MKSDDASIDGKVGRAVDDLWRQALHYSGGDSVTAEIEFDRLRGQYISRMGTYVLSGERKGVLAGGNDINAHQPVRLLALVAVIYGLALASRYDLPNTTPEEPIGNYSIDYK